MSITEHTGIIRGTKVNSATQVSRSGIVRTAGGGGGTPLEDAVNALFTAGVTGDYWKPYDWTTLNQLSTGLGSAVTAASDPVGYVAGQRTEGTALNLIQAAAGRRGAAADFSGTLGITAPSNNRNLQATFSSVNHPILVAIRFTTPASWSITNENFISAETSGYSQVARLYPSATGKATLKGGTEIVDSGSMGSSTAYYLTGLANSGSSQLWKDAISVATGSLSNTTNAVNVSILGRQPDSSSNCKVCVEKVVMLQNPGAGARETIEAWLAVEGDA